MDTVATRLVRCFSLVFPAMPEERIPGASAQTVEEWDSVAQVTLLTVIAEEFGIEVDFEEFEDAVSFDALAAKLREKSAGA